MRYGLLKLTLAKRFTCVQVNLPSLRSRPVTINDPRIGSRKPHLDKEQIKDGMTDRIGHLYLIHSNLAFQTGASSYLRTAQRPESCFYFSLCASSLQDYLNKLSPSGAWVCFDVCF